MAPKQMVAARRDELVRRRRVRCLGVAVAVVLAACTDAGATPQDEVPDLRGGSTSPDQVQSPEFDDLPDEQRVYFEDGKVTLQEYQEAYGRFLRCAEEAGVADVFHEVGRDPVTGVITYSVSSFSDELLAPGQFNASRLNDCYQRWFVQAEIAFHVSDPAVLAAQLGESMKFFDENLRPCLEHIGVAVPDHLEVNDENWGSLNDQAVQAIQDGRCAGVGSSANP